MDALITLMIILICVLLIIFVIMLRNRVINDIIDYICEYGTGEELTVLPQTYTMVYDLSHWNKWTLNQWQIYLRKVIQRQKLMIMYRIACPEAGYPVSEARYYNIQDYELCSGKKFPNVRN